MIIDKDFSLFYGIMLGDGCLSKVGRHLFIAVTLNLKDDPPFLHECILPLLSKFTGRQIAVKIREKDCGIGVNFMDKSLFEYIASVGFPIGKKGTTLKIPKIFYQKKLLRYVCQGLFATDGSLVLTNNNGTLYPRVEINSISKSLMHQVSDFLNKIGIKCHFYEAKRRKEEYGWNKRYRLQINGKHNLAKFVRLIGFVNPKQVDKLNFYLRQTGEGRI